MAYNEELAQRVRSALTREALVEEKRMMGGLTFMVNGKMCVGVAKDDLMVRLAPEVYESALERFGCREMDFTGKPMRGFVFVGPEALGKEEELEYWLELALDFNKTAKAARKHRAENPARR